MNKEELLKALEELSKAKTDNPISAMNSINVDDFMSAVDRLNKVPTYDVLLKENKKQKEIIDKAKVYINENKDKYYQDWGQDDSSVDTYLGEYEIKELLDILKEVSE